MNEVDSLKRAVQALAQPWDVQIGLFPELVVVGDELALDFDDAFKLFIATSRIKLDREQHAALEALNNELDRLSGPADPEFWLDRNSLKSDARWEKLRLLAVCVLNAMGWPNVDPGPSEAIYVPGGHG